MSCCDLKLEDYFTRFPHVSVAFSGGADSTYLLYAARTYAKTVRAYFVESAFQPRFEREDAKRLARQLGVELRILPLDPLSIPEVAGNLPDRCYHCKKAIFQAILQAAAEDGCTVLLDGTNASDDAKERPGMRALEELSVRSPLRECGLEKSQIRQLSKQAGLFTWDKPAYACLATRIAAGEEITPDKLSAAEASEEDLFSLGFTDFRVRSQNGHARLELPLAQFPLALKHREEILHRLKAYYQTVSLNLEARK